MNKLDKTPGQAVNVDAVVMPVPGDRLPHRLRGRSAENNRRLRLAIVDVRPGHRGLCALPNNGQRACDVLSSTIRNEYVDPCVNHTDKPIRVYHGVWDDNGNNAGYFWPDHVIVEA